MKYFKKTAEIGPVSKNNEKLWLDIVKLFHPTEKVKVNNFTSIREILDNAREEYYSKLRAE